MNVGALDLAVLAVYLTGVVVFGVRFSYEGAHDAANDIGACARSFFRLVEAGHFRL